MWKPFPRLEGRQAVAVAGREHFRRHFDVDRSSVHANHRPEKPCDGWNMQQGSRLNTQD
jgi:hypothetical protein